MRSVIIYCLLLFFSAFSFAASDQEASTSLNDVLSRHYKALGSVALLNSNSSRIRGNLSLATLTIPFEAVQVQNKYYYFKQNKVLQGMDLSPPIIKKVNNEGAYFVVDETDMGSGLNVTRMPDQARNNWINLNTTELSPLFYFKKMGFVMHLGSFFQQGDQSFHQISVLTNTGHKIVVLLNAQTNLIHSMVFNSFHPQLGLVEVVRTFDNYVRHQGVLIPEKWTDQRTGIKIVYSITDIEWVNDVNHDLFAIDGLSSDNKLTDRDIRTVIDGYLLALDEQSPFLTSIEKLRVELLKNQEEGQYSKITSSSMLAQFLTEQMITLIGDYHFGIDYNPELFTLLADNHSESGTVITSSQQQRLSSSMYSKKIPDKDFYYLKIEEMLPIELARDVIDSHMLQANNHLGLIIDLRNNTGGAGSFNRYLASYLLPANTMIYQRVLKNQTESIMTVKTRYSLEHLKAIPVYVFVDRNTVSAGEQLAYLLQNHQRATIIGETTFGAAHGSIDVPLIKGLIGLVPIAYEKHVLTKQDWEGSGVIPDITTATQDLTLLIQQIGDEE
ncbi:MAG: hypothetical protein KDI92_01465 [Xanthomonadales bacterium]|nr:hypothetical protein [Xanthomonadales bacterium]